MVLLASSRRVFKEVGPRPDGLLQECMYRMKAAVMIVKIAAYRYICERSRLQIRPALHLYW